LDFKEGVTFQSFANVGREEFLPHARTIGLESDVEFGIAVLEALYDEYLRRLRLFKSRNVRSIKELREKFRETRMPSPSRKYLDANGLSGYRERWAAPHRQANQRTAGARQEKEEGKADRSGHSKPGASRARSDQSKASQAKGLKEDSAAADRGDQRQRRMNVRARPGGLFDY
jgi:hypothetical protein